MINVDASFCSDSGTGSTGAIIRDYTGGFITAAQRYIPHVVDAAMAEAHALRDGSNSRRNLEAIGSSFKQTACRWYIP